MDIDQRGGRGAAGPSRDRGAQHFPALQPPGAVTEAALRSHQQPPDGRGNQQNGAATAASGAAAGGSAPAAGRQQAAGGSEAGPRVGAAGRPVQRNAGAAQANANPANAAAVQANAAAAVGLGDLLARAEQSVRLMFSLQVADNLLSTAQQLHGLEQAFLHSLREACGGDAAAVEEVAAMPKPVQRGVCTTSLVAFVKREAAEQLYATLGVGLGGLQVSVAGVPSPCRAMLHSRAPACRPLYLFTLETSHARYPPDALGPFIRAHAGLFGGIEVQWLGRVSVSGRLVVDRVDHLGAVLPDCPSPAHYPGTIMGLAMGGQCVLNEAIHVLLPAPAQPAARPSAVPLPAPAPAAPIRHTSETFLLRRLPNRACDTPPVPRWHNRMARMVVRDDVQGVQAAPVLPEQVPGGAPPPAASSQVAQPAQQRVVAVAGAAAAGAGVQGGTVGNVNVVRPPPPPSHPPQAEEPQPVVPPLADQAVDNALALVPWQPPLVGAPGQPPAAQLAPAQPSAQAAAAALPVGQAQLVAASGPQVVANVGTTGDVVGAAMVIGGGNVEGGVPARARRLEPELLPCGTWVQWGGGGAGAHRNVGLLVAYVWVGAQHRLVPRVMLAAHATPAWRDVAASALRAVPADSVLQEAKQAVGAAVQANAAQVFASASLVVTDWPSTQVVFAPGFAPPGPTTEPAHRLRLQVRAQPSAATPPARGKTPRPQGARGVRQPHPKIQRLQSGTSGDMDTDGDDSPYGDNASLNGSEADRYNEITRYEQREPPTDPASALALTLALPGPSGGRRGGTR